MANKPTNEKLFKTNKKRTRRVLSIGEKVDILNQLENGEKATAVAKRLNLNESTIRTIRRASKEIRRNYDIGTSFRSKCLISRRPHIQTMERRLHQWIMEQKQQPVSNSQIREKALEIYNELSNEESIENNPVEKPFKASKGWFEKFKTRFPSNKTELYHTTVTNDTNVVNDTNEFEQIYLYQHSPPQIKSERIEKIKETNEFKTDLTILDVREGIQMANKLSTFFLNNDSNTERSKTFLEMLLLAMKPYIELEKELKEKLSQPTILEYFPRITPS